MSSATDQIRAAASAARGADGYGRNITHPCLDGFSRPGGADCREGFCRLCANRAANGWNPAQQRAFRSQRHCRPAPKAEAIDVAHDQRVGELEFGIDAVVDAPSGGGKRVPGFPVRAPVTLTCLDVAELHAQVACAAVQHAPHRAGLGGCERAEHGVAENDLRVITTEHRIDVAAAERSAKYLDDS